ncbi:uncharacterized protein EI97DRAFT_489193 [Westerdykella ornata]|uniref:Cell death in tomato 1 n=1 Tax=Westerdykella ornata TaxID=318751 RepID=A0A6A6JPP2_WESOR|nr:uncharacterized protein EI97DRAFT_489193 [Westerdykella ornata]KAF2277646.1 hypothetical protein EI97DRAFT_489193 [Westerdykella ornata]
MHFATVLLPTLLSFTTPILSAPTLSPRETSSSLLPWQLTGIGFFSPSGRPGNYPWNTITASITDPNALDLGTNKAGQPVTLPANNTASNCRAIWLRGENPFNRSWPCDDNAEADGYWTMEILQTPEFGLTNFDVRFRRVAEVGSLGQRFARKFVGEVHLQAPETLSGTCGGSGVCSWGLRGEG